MGVHLLACRYGNFIIYQRFVLCVILILTLANLYAMRTISLESLEYLSGKKKGAEDNIKTNQTAAVWDRKKTMIASGAFHIGYTFTHVPFGILCDLYGARHILTLGVLICSILTLVTPTIMAMEAWMMIGKRLTLGMAQGACLPAFFSLISYWTQRQYITVFTTFCFSGGTMGKVFGVVASYYFQGKLNNWRSLYYFWGCSGLVCFLLLESFAFSRPATHPFVSLKEKTQLQQDMGTILPSRVPLKQILTDSGVWAITIGQIGHNWLLFIVFTNLSHYFINVAQLNEFQQLISIVWSHLIFWLSIVSFGIIGNYCIRKRYIPVIYLRTIYTAIGSILASVTMILMTFSGSNNALISVWVVLNMISWGPTYPGLKVNILDLTRYYAGTVFGIENGVGGIIGIFSDAIMYQICPNHTVEEWRKVGYLSFALCTFTATMFFVWAKGERGKWDYLPHEKR